MPDRVLSAPEAPGFTLERVEAALAGTFDANALTDDEWDYFVDGFGMALGTDTPAGVAFWAAFDRSVNTDSFCSLSAKLECNCGVAQCGAEDQK